MARQEMATRREGERWRWPGHMATKGLACDGGRRRQEGGVNTTISQKRDAQAQGTEAQTTEAEKDGLETVRWAQQCSIFYPVSTLATPRCTHCEFFACMRLAARQEVPVSRLRKALRAMIGCDCSGRRTGQRYVEESPITSSRKSTIWESCL